MTDAAIDRCYQQAGSRNIVGEGARRHEIHLLKGGWQRTPEAGPPVSPRRATLSVEWHH